MGRPKKTTVQRRQAFQAVNEEPRSQKRQREHLDGDMKENVAPDETVNQTSPIAQQHLPIHTPHSSKETQCFIPAVVSTCHKAVQVKPSTKRNVPCPDVTKKSEETKGRRLVNLSSLDELINAVSFHSTICGKGPAQRISEKKNGLHTSIIYACGCGKRFTVSSDGPGDTLPINDAVAWGSAQSAIGFQSMSGLFATLDVPTPCFNKYKKHQTTFHDTLIEAMKKDMRKWAEKEAELAKEAGDYVTVNGVKYPAITVIVDGGWSKRSYKHSFSSKCGVAVIIGARTKKIIYMDTKISSCYICSRYTKDGQVKPHICYKNYSGSPTGMESTIIKEGFQSSISMYNLVCSKFVGDGDSSVHSQVQNVYPEMQVEKIECVNHVMRNFTTRLMDISGNRVRGKDAPKISLEERRIFNPVVPRFRTGLLQAITYHHKNGSSWKELYDDIQNIRHHIFGEHDKCKSYFCKGPKDKELNRVPTVSKLPIWNVIGSALERPASLAPSLVKKESSNCAECFMAVACKYIEGKRKHFDHSYMYQLRMAAAVFAYNESTFWANKAYEFIKESTAGNEWLKKANESKTKRERKQVRYVKKPLKPQQLCPPNFEYGENPQRPDLSPDILQIQINEKRASLQVTNLEAKDIEAATLGQSDLELWFRHRYGRITASKAGSIYSLRDSTDSTNTLNDYFCRSRNVESVRLAMEYGRENEANAIMKYEDVKGLERGTVKRSGFVVYENNGILGAFSDGYVGSDGLVEVKCPHSLYLKQKDPKSWSEISRTASIKKNTDDEFFLKRNHAHYFQVIMQIYITNRQWCDYVIWSEFGDPFIERITRSTETDILWKKMQEKFSVFWELDLAPELVDSRFDRGYTEYRISEKRIADRKMKLLRKKEKKMSI